MEGQRKAKHWCQLRKRSRVVKYHGTKTRCTELLFIQFKSSLYCQRPGNGGRILDWFR